ncbi:MAG TPA: hypothetical protein VFQ85_03470 [Mycobacteriales bacterium]|nr:hypothetical protein [Mycobacteriales bacterium]
MAGSRGLGALAAGLVLAGGLLTHALDEEGLLPGVHEAERVREFAERGAARPLLLLGCVLLSAATGALVARQARRRCGLDPRALLALVVAGQAAQFASFEVVARLAAGLDVAEVFVEPAFATGVLVQVLIAGAFVALLLLAARRLGALLATPAAPWHPAPAKPLTRTAPRAGTRRAEARPQGRAPPGPVVPVPQP